MRKILVILAIAAIFVSCKQRTPEQGSRAKGISDRVLSGGHCSRIDGGYENLVAVGKAKSDDGEEVTIVFGGGNHATNDLGATFPWAHVVGGEMFGIGFNDMSIALISKADTRIFNFAAPFADKDLSVGWEDRKKEKKSMLDIGWYPEGPSSDSARIKSFTFARQQAKTFPGLGAIGRSEIAEISYQLFVKNTERVDRREGFKRKGSLWDLLTHFAQTDTCENPADPDMEEMCKLGGAKGNFEVDNDIPGLALGEFPFSLDATQSNPSTLTLTYEGKTRKYQITSLIGGLERSIINIVAVKNFCFDIIDFEKLLTMHMQYDYISLHPATPGQNGCGRESFAGYISGLLNHNEPGALAASMMNDFVKRNATSGVFLAADGEKESVNLLSYNQIKNVRDIEAVKELNFVKGDGHEFNWIDMPVGPGIFDRRIVELKEQNTGCTWFGMLETQRLPTDPVPNPRGY